MRAPERFLYGNVVTCAVRGRDTLAGLAAGCSPKPRLRLRRRGDVRGAWSRRARRPARRSLYVASSSATATCAERGGVKLVGFSVGRSLWPVVSVCDRFKDVETCVVRGHDT